jgi:hypothetical protein
MHVSSGRRGVAGIALLLFGLVGAVSCASGPQVTGANTKCKRDYNHNAGLIPLSDDVDYLMNNYHGCLVEVAAAQDNYVVASGSNDQPQTIPCDPSGARTTQIQVAEYLGASQLSDASYGDGGTKQRGYVVARVRNLGDCKPIGKVAIPPHSEVLWIIDRKHDDQILRAHLVIRRADGKEEFVRGKHDRNIRVCRGHTGRTGDQAWFRTAVCNDAVPPGGGSAGGTASVSRSSSPPDPENDPGLWLVCGGNCCYTTEDI